MPPLYPMNQQPTREPNSIRLLSHSPITRILRRRAYSYRDLRCALRTGLWQLPQRMHLAPAARPIHRAPRLALPPLRHSDLRHRQHSTAELDPPARPLPCLSRADSPALPGHRGRHRRALSPLLPHLRPLRTRRRRSHSRFLLVGLAITDAETFLLPDALTIPGIALGLLFAAWTAPWNPHTGPWPAWGSHPHLYSLSVSAKTALAASAVVLVIRWLYWLVRRQEGMGLGDAKLMAMIGAWFGPAQTGLIFFIAVIAGALYGLALIAASIATRPSRRLKRRQDATFQPGRRSERSYAWQRSTPSSGVGRH